MTGSEITLVVYLALIVLVAAGWIRSKITGQPIDNSEAWEKRHPKPPELEAVPWGFSWWQLPVFAVQAAFVGWWVYQAGQDGQSISLIFFVALILCAFLTACLTQSLDWIVRRLRPLERHGREARGDSLRLARTGRSLGKPAEHPERIRVRD